MDKKIRLMHILPARDPLQIKTHTQTENKGIEKILH